MKNKYVMLFLLFSFLLISCGSGDSQKQTSLGLDDFNVAPKNEQIETNLSDMYKTDSFSLNDFKKSSEKTDSSDGEVRVSEKELVADYQDNLQKPVVPLPAQPDATTPPVSSPFNARVVSVSSSTNPGLVSFSVTGNCDTGFVLRATWRFPGESLNQAKGANVKYFPCTEGQFTWTHSIQDSSISGKVQVDIWEDAEKKLSHLATS